MSTEIVGPPTSTNGWCARRPSARCAKPPSLSCAAGRFPDLADDVAAAISAAHVDVLHDVVAHAGTDNVEQIRARLGL